MKKILIISILSICLLPKLILAEVGDDWIEQYGITWTFDKNLSTDGAGDTYQYGTFANGDYWVVGPVNITDISPNSTGPSGQYDRIINGSMINPSPATGSAQGYDSDMFAWNAGNRSTPARVAYDENLNVARSEGVPISAGDPLSVQALSSLISTITDIPTIRSSIKTAVVLTVLAEAPPSNSFRPPYSGTDKSITFNKSDLLYTPLSNLSHVDDTPSMETVTDNFDQLWLDHIPDWASRYQHPVDSMPNYSRDFSQQIAQAALLLNSDFTNNQKETLLIYFTQLGIDNYRNMEHGLNLIRGNWKPSEGKNMGRKLPIVFAGRILGGSIGEYDTIADKMLNIPKWNSEIELGNFNPVFQEDLQYWEIVQADTEREVVGVNIPANLEQYTEELIGLPEWGTRHLGPAAYPNRDDASWGANYRHICAVGIIGHALTVHIMGLKEAWDNDVFFDYYDRWWAETDGATLNSQVLNDFTRNMWEAYRADYGPVWTPDNMQTYTNIYCVKADATGNNNGSDWDNAYAQLPDVLERGAVYYVADGEYSPYTFNDPEDGEKYITIKKATKDKHGANTGWQDFYGDEQAVFLLQNGSDKQVWKVYTDYWVFDGQSGGGPDDWYGDNIPYGFKLTGPVDRDLSNIEMVRTCETDASAVGDNLQFRHIEFTTLGFRPDDPKDSTEQNPSRDYMIVAQLSYTVEGTESKVGSNNVTISHCYFHDFQIAIQGDDLNNWIVEYNCFARSLDDIWGPPYQADGVKIYNSNNMTFRYNLWEDCSNGTACLFFGGGTQTGLHPDVNIKNTYIYGNIFYNTDDNQYGTSRRGIIGVFGDSGYDNDVSDFYVYNNSFINLYDNNGISGLYFDCDSSENIVIQNNIFSGCDNTVADYNAFIVNANTVSQNWYYDCAFNGQDRASDLAGAESGGQFGTQDPFINWQGKNFSLKTPTDAGIDLGAPYNTDMFGNTRGADGVWDRGAYEYFSGQVVDPGHDPDPEPDVGVVIPDQTLLRVYNNIIKSGGNAEVTINCDVKDAGKLTVKIYDAKGREIITLWNKHEEPGIVPITWHGQDSSNNKVGSGVYLVHMECGGYKETKKIAIIR